jgi:hypothetical protein
LRPGDGAPGLVAHRPQPEARHLHLFLGLGGLIAHAAKRLRIGLRRRAFVAHAAERTGTGCVAAHFAQTGIDGCGVGRRGGRGLAGKAARFLRGARRGDKKQGGSERARCAFFVATRQGTHLRDR